MKNIIFTLSCIAILTACQNKANKDGMISTDLVSNPVSASSPDTVGKAYPKIFFYETTYDFGKITQGEKRDHIYKFKNTGKSDLIISSAEGSCGCTIPEYTKEPVKPGQESAIHVIFNSEGKHGAQHKTVTVIANTIPNATQISLTGEVLIQENTKY